MPSGMQEDYTARLYFFYAALVGLPPMGLSHFIQPKAVASGVVDAGLVGGFLLFAFGLIHLVRGVRLQRDAARSAPSGPRIPKVPVSVLAESRRTRQLSVGAAGALLVAGATASASAASSLAFAVIGGGVVVGTLCVASAAHHAVRADEIRRREWPSAGGAEERAVNCDRNTSLPKSKNRSWLVVFLELEMLLLAASMWLINFVIHLGGQ